jgi:membrane fusion protein, multidrug efflux system
MIGGPPSRYVGQVLQHNGPMKDVALCIACPARGPLNPRTLPSMSTHSFLPGLLAAFVLVGCSTGNTGPQTLVPDVTVVTVGRMDVPIVAEYVGQTYGQQDVEIQARVSGILTGIHFNEGELVKAGTLLYTIDDQPIRNKVDAAAGRLAQANTQLVRMKADLDRVEPLAAMNALSRRDLDASRAAYSAAQAEVDIARAALANANIELGYTRIMAPCTGVIGASRSQVGDLVGGLSLDGVLNTISAIGGMRVRFAISEGDMLELMRLKGDSSLRFLPEARPVSLLLSDGTPYPGTGTLDFADRQVDPGTGSMLVQARFTNEAGLLRPGQYVRVRFLKNELKDALLVPQQAVIQMQNVYQLLVLKADGTVEPRRVRMGLRTGSNWVVLEGVQAGEKVAIVGSLAVKPGAPVKAQEMPWDYAAANAK